MSSTAVTVLAIARGILPYTVFGNHYDRSEVMCRSTLPHWYLSDGVYIKTVLDCNGKHLKSQLQGKHEDILPTNRT